MSPVSPVFHTEVTIKECFTEVKQMYLLYLWDSLVTLELISLILLVGSPDTDPLAVKLLDNRPYMGNENINGTVKIKINLTNVKLARG